MRRPRNISLAALVAGTLATVMTIVLGTYSFISYRIDANRQRKDLEDLMKLQIHETAVALALPVWNIDRPQIDRVVEAMAKPKSIHALSVTFAGETRGVIRGSDLERTYLPWDGKSAPAGLLVKEAPVTSPGTEKEIGSVRILVTPQFLNEDLDKAKVSIITPIVGINVVLIACIYFMLWRAVVRPLMSIERFAVSVSHGGHDPMPASVYTSASELVSLHESLETMIRLLDRRYAEMQEEAALRFESEQRLQTIYNSVSDAISIYDADTGAVVDVNRAFTELLGYSYEEALQGHVGSNVSGLGPYQREMALEKVRSMKPGEQYYAEWQLRHHDGRLLWTEVSARFALIGGARRVIAVSRDITQRKEMEEALRRSETMSAMGALVAGVAHEVRNPLFGITATIDAFEAEFGSGEGAAEYMTTLRNDVGRLSRLMHDLLEYGRPQALELHLQDLQPLLAETLRICAPRARERRIVIREDIAQDLPEVSIDADRMLQVLKNVVENAIAFSKEGETVEISARRADGVSVVLAVADRGSGFRSEDLPHAFKPFFTRRPGGSGLGLAIAQKIVTEHGGTITAANRPGGGAVIEIRLG
jgi:PAS domain S-box-containing protein